MNTKNEETATDPRLEIARTNIRLALALRDMNASEAARGADMGRNGVSQFTSGKTSIKYENMLALCDVLDIPIGILHKQDAITESRLRLYKLIERLPDHLVQKALNEALDVSGQK